MKTIRRKGEDQPLYPISVVAHMMGVHPQTLRLYERQGLISPSRTKGKTRLYSERDVELLKTILYLTQDLGVNLAGVGLLLDIQAKMHEVENEMWRTVESLSRRLHREDREGREGRQDSGEDERPGPKPIKIRIEPG